MNYITLPNQRRVSVGQYAAAWKAIQAAPDALYPGFDHFPTRGREILAKMRAGLHDRINRHLPPIPARAEEAFWELSRLARDLPRRILIRERSLSPHARRIATKHFPHRLHTED